MANESYRGPTGQGGGMFSGRLCAACGWLLLALWTSAWAQTAAPAGAHGGLPAQSSAAARHHRTWHKKPSPAVVAAPVVPPPPPAPVLPADQPPAPAKIAYSGGNLRIDAENSSLVATLNDVSRRTGVAIEGLGRDERIYGQYGPGPVTATLSKLLDGSGYDYVLVGGGEGKSPTKLLLTQAGTASAGMGSTPASVPQSPPPGNGGAYVPANPSEPVQPKTPQQIFDELRKMHPPQ